MQKYKNHWAKTIHCHAHWHQITTPQVSSPSILEVQSPPKEESKEESKDENASSSSSETKQINISSNSSDTSSSSDSTKKITL